MLPLPAVALLWITLLGFGHISTWLLVVMGASTALMLGNAVSISLRIRLARVEGHDGSADPS
jgi:hypothetical protein